MRHAYTNIIKKTLAAGALAAALGTSSVALADPHVGRGHERGIGQLMWGSPMQVANAAQRLGLSETQRSELDAIMDAARVQLRPLANAAVAARRQMRELTRAQTFDEAALRAAAGKVSSAQIEVTIAQARLRDQLNAVLTPEQREMLAHMPKGRRGKHGGGRRGRHGQHHEGHYGRGMRVPRDDAAQPSQ